MLLVLLTYLLAALVLSWSWKFGGGPERNAAIVICAWVGVGLIYHPITVVSAFDRVDRGLLAFDILFAVALTVIALAANRIWPLFAAGFSMIPILGHMAVALEHRGVSRAYWAMNQVPFYLILVALMIGTVAHRKRVVRGHIATDWEYDLRG